MERRTALKTALLQNYSAENAEKFLSYSLTKEDLAFIQDTAKEVLRKMPPKAFNCTQISAIWAAIIEDHSNIPVSVICGDLHFTDKKIFVCKEPLPGPEAGSVIDGIWDGHCWLEFGGLIADASFFRTVYFGEVPHQFKNLVIQKFGQGHGTIIATPEQMRTNELIYLPKYSLSDIQINGLINGIER
ncbi:hypothetical protein ABIE26_003989 [Pedobacter africanus]|uniref:Uncharacterized protein n=1 Tax=Pedobacter africanus TaxID=151894 RepID=A0ACC6L0Y1_9SPHI|nr:hypothetical protein [Pedobacter africanus]MDR6785290.1 hypothetical protein [Pedobacter africanus]